MFPFQRKVDRDYRKPGSNKLASDQKKKIKRLQHVCARCGSVLNSFDLRYDNE